VTGILLAAAIAISGASADATTAAARSSHSVTAKYCAKHKHARKCQKQPVKHTNRVFAANSIWDTPLASSAPLDPKSADYVTTLLNSVQTKGDWINTTQWSAPVYRVPAAQATVEVKLDKPAGVHEALRAALKSVPLPANAQPSNDTDSELVVWQQSTDTFWEFWGLTKQSDGWHARYGGKMTNVSTSPGYFPANPGWGAAATGLPLLGGMINLDELNRGTIDHALALSIPGPARGKIVFPAQRGDGDSDDPNAIPEGTRFRLDPKLDISKLKIPGFTRALALAAQKYGIVVTDKAANVQFEAEDPTPLGYNPYWPSATGFFGGKYPNQLLDVFPWAALQVVKP
jgi:hypothetical protein